VRNKASFSNFTKLQIADADSASWQERLLGCEPTCLSLFTRLANDPSSPDKVLEKPSEVLMNFY